MQDIARLAGVSRVAVSYALNGRPGVSAELRKRILSIAREAGFSPNAYAKAMRGAAANAAGLVLQRPSSGFHQELISGIQIALSARGFGLVLQFAASAQEELAIYRRWHAERRVDGVIVCDPRVDDLRIPALKRLGLPTVVIGGRGDVAGLAHLWSDERAAAVKAVGYLHALGHRRVALRPGTPGTLQTAWRAEAFTVACREFGITPALPESGGAGRPTAIVYDTDLMAIAGLHAAVERGLSVPGDVSIVAWEDSPLCQVVRPALSVLKRNLTDIGLAATRLLFEWIDGQPPRGVQHENATFVVRGSTIPPR